MFLITNTRANKRSLFSSRSWSISWACVRRCPWSRSRDSLSKWSKSHRRIWSWWRYSRPAHTSWITTIRAFTLIGRRSTLRNSIPGILRCLSRSCPSTTCNHLKLNKVSLKMLTSQVCSSSPSISKTLLFWMMMVPSIKGQIRKCPLLSSDTTVSPRGSRSSHWEGKQWCYK